MVECFIIVLLDIIANSASEIILEKRSTFGKVREAKVYVGPRNRTVICQKFHNFV